MYWFFIFDIIYLRSAFDRYLYNIITVKIRKNNSFLLLFRCAMCILTKTLGISITAGSYYTQQSFPGAVWWVDDRGFTLQLKTLRLAIINAF